MEDGRSLVYNLCTIPGGSFKELDFQTFFSVVLNSFSLWSSV
jgi:hypothetical protein